jgi:hypothetical protein
VICLGPRDPGEIVGPRPLSGVVVRPLNFTVRPSIARSASFGSWALSHSGGALCCPTTDAGCRLRGPKEAGR